MNKRKLHAASRRHANAARRLNRIAADILAMFYEGIDVSDRWDRMLEARASADHHTYMGRTFAERARDANH